jgi:type I restriction enzyme S subunit
MKNISQDRLLAIPVWIPPQEEQLKIAAVLRTWDEANENLSRQRGLREKQYLGLRDYLIDWSKNRQAVKDFLKPVSRPIPKPTSGYRALSIRSHGKGTFDRFVEDPETVEMDTLYVAKAGDIIVNITFAWEGAVALVPRDHDGCLVSHRFPVFVPEIERVDARYLRHVLRMPRFTYLLGIVSPGGAGRNRVLSKSDFLELMVPLPPLDLQRRIATILDDAEKAIAAEEKYLSALNRQKRGLMQRLLTGKWRVTAEGGAL